jgi:hypothetical protein
MIDSLPLLEESHDEYEKSRKKIVHIVDISARLGINTRWHTGSAPVWQTDHRRLRMRATFGCF